MIPAADHLRVALGGKWSVDEPARTWPMHLYSAIDDAVEAFWLCRAGYTIGAAAIARTLLERWTHNVAHHHDIPRDEVETDAEYMTRVWSVYADFGVPANVGQWWNWLSELLHGRGAPLGDEFGGATRLQSDPSRNISIHEALSYVLDIALRQVRGGLTLLAVDAGHDDYIPALQMAPLDLSSFKEPPVDVFADAFRDLDFFECRTKRSQGWAEISDIYQGNVESPEANLDKRLNPVFTVEALLERRGRLVKRARRAFESEMDQLGSDFDPGYLAAKLFRFACIAELAQLLAGEHSGVEAEAFRTASDAQRAATHLWLEDSDFAMACVRIVLEQTARLRAHRLRPQRALRLEQLGGGAATHRWLELAGWTRLAPLARAVAEFSHMTPRSRREGARDLLRRAQYGRDSLETSRGSALNDVAYLLAFEMHSRLLVTHPLVAAELTRSITLIDEGLHSARLEKWLNHTLSLRDHDLGLPDVARGAGRHRENPEVSN